MIIILKILAGMCLLVLAGLLYALQSDEFEKHRRELALSTIGVLALGLGLVVYLEQIKPFIFDEGPIQKAKKGGGGNQAEDDDDDGPEKDRSGGGSRSSSSSSARSQMAADAGKGSFNRVSSADKKTGTYPKDCEFCPEMTTIEGGIFTLGAAEDDSDAQPNEFPTTDGVSIDTFAMSVSQISNQQFKAFITATGRRVTATCNGDAGLQLTSNSEPSGGLTDDQPALCVSWVDATAYIRWLGGQTGFNYRLLSASQWEYVAKGGRDQDNQAKDAGKLARLGVDGLLGENGDWVEDCWTPSLAGVPRDGRAFVPRSTCDRIVKGGTWLVPGQDVRPTARAALPMTTQMNKVGFRIFRPLTMKDCDYCPQMAMIAGGTFNLGAGADEKDAQPSERPIIEDVKIRKFVISAAPVTTKEYASFAAATGRAITASCAPDQATRTGRPAAASGAPDEDGPADCVSWRDASDYVTWLSAQSGQAYRMVSAAEWEYVAKGGPHHRETGVPIATKLNRLGIVGLSGAGGEWVADCWTQTLTGMPRDGSAWVQQSGCPRIVKGGPGLSATTPARASMRTSQPANARLSGIGFRIARASE